MKLIILFLAIVSMVFIMLKIYETKETTIEQALMMSIDMFYIIGISTKII